ncbi:MAG: hypothetical protein IPH69_17995 [Bacteroidales bacterium]|nr:hypothetical protein [Bacteroidales bacterium]
MIWRLLDIFFGVSFTFHNTFQPVWLDLEKDKKVQSYFTPAHRRIVALLGLIVGTLGYCPLIGWHFAVLETRATDLPLSYVKYLADRLTGLTFSSNLVDSVTLYAFLAALVLSLFLTSRDYFKASRLSN